MTMTKKVLVWWIEFAVVFISLQVRCCFSHGRLIEPPSRASAWRYGFQTTPDYNDHELYCGGFTRQWKRNEGKCGVCGDAWDLSVPRPHENGGQWGQGVIVRKYLPSSEMVIRVELTASHMGYFEFRLCPDPDASQDCLDKNLLIIKSGSPSQPMPTDLETRFYPRNGSRIYEMKAQLPAIECFQCVLQWRYIAGNNWGMCPDGNGAVGCGPQEEFRSCADIAIGEGVRPLRPIPPSPRSTVRPKVSSTSTESTKQKEVDDGISAWGFILALLFAVFVFGLVFWYLHKYHNQKIKQWRQFANNGICWNQKKTRSVGDVTGASTTSLAPKHSVLNVSIFNDKESHSNSPPLPPPRVKRNSRVTEIKPEQSSVH